MLSASARLPAGKLRAQQLHLRGGVSKMETGMAAPRDGEVVVKRRAFKDDHSGWRAVKMCDGRTPADWRYRPLADCLVNTVPAAVELALENRASGEGGAGGQGQKELVAGEVFVCRGMHEWKQARLIVGGWRADRSKPYESCDERHATGHTAEVRGDGGADERGSMAPPQEYNLNIRAEADARTWGLWFLEPESGGSFRNLSCACSMELDDEVILVNGCLY